MKLSLPLFALGLALLSASAAHAFTIEEQGVTSGGARIADPDARVSRFGNSGDGQTTIKQGNTTLQFGTQRSFDQRFDKQQMFEPNGRPLGDR